MSGRQRAARGWTVFVGSLFAFLLVLQFGASPWPIGPDHMAGPARAPAAVFLTDNIPAYAETGTPTPLKQALKWVLQFLFGAFGPADFSWDELEVLAWGGLVLLGAVGLLRALLHFDGENLSQSRQRLLNAAVWVGGAVWLLKAWEYSRVS